MCVGLGVCQRERKRERASIRGGCVREAKRERDGLVPVLAL